MKRNIFSLFAALILTIGVFIIPGWSHITGNLCDHPKEITVHRQGTGWCRGQYDFANIIVFLVDTDEDGDIDMQDARIFVPEEGMTNSLLLLKDCDNDGLIDVGYYVVKGATVKDGMEESWILERISSKHPIIGKSVEDARIHEYSNWRFTPEVEGDAE